MALQRWMPNRGPQMALLRTRCFEVLYGGAAGGGKIQRLDSVVWTPFGPKPIGELRPGAQVCAPDGGVARVVIAHPTQRVPLYRFTFADGASTIVGEDHLWYAWLASKKVKAERRYPHGTEPRRGKVWTTAQIIEEFRKAEKSKSKGKRTYWPIVPLAEPACFTPPRGRWRNPRTVPPYTLGALLGDGTITPKTPTIGITGIDPLIMWEIGLEIGAMGLALVQDDEKHWRIPASRELRANLKDLGALGYSHTKAVPRPYLIAPAEVRWSVLQGLLDTDGTADSRGHVSFTSVSRQLALDVQWLARSLGFKATRSESYTGKYRNSDGDMVECRDAWDVYIQGHDTGLLFRLPRKRQRCRRYNGGTSEPGRRLIGVEYVGEDEARCITVDHPSGLYLTDDFIVTHNSDALLAGAARYVHNKHWKALLMRRTIPELEGPEGLVERSYEMYAPLGGIYNQQRKVWRFPSGARIDFASCENEADVRRFGGWQLTYLGFDELTTFTQKIYEFLFSRVRSPHGLPCFVRSSSNPGGPGHDWVLKRWRWWLYREGIRTNEFDGPYVGPGDKLYIKRDPDSGEDALSERGVDGAMSRMFIPALLVDNPFLAATDYGQRLKMLDPLTRRQLAEGDWMARAAPGIFFNRAWVHMIDAPPQMPVARIRYWDRAATDTVKAKAQGKMAAWTAGALMSVDVHNNIYIEHMTREQRDPGGVLQLISDHADKDGCQQVLERDPGQAGKAEIDMYRRELGSKIADQPVSGDKLTRFKPFSAAASNTEENPTRIYVVRGSWNSALFDELEAVPTGLWDQADAVSGGFNWLDALGGARLAKSGKVTSAFAGDRAGGF